MTNKYARVTIINKLIPEEMKYNMQWKNHFIHGQSHRQESNLMQ